MHSVTADVTADRAQSADHAQVGVESSESQQRRPLHWWIILLQHRSASLRCRHPSGSRPSSPLISCKILRHPTVAVRRCAQGSWDTVQVGADSAALHTDAATTAETVKVDIAACVCHTADATP